MPSALPPDVGRRRFVLALAAGTLAAPAVVRAGEVQTFRLQTAWPAANLYNEFAGDFARKVGEMSGGRLRIDVLPAGSVVPPFSLLEAVHKGIVDAAHSVPGYWYGKNPAYALFGNGPSFGMDGNLLLAWIEHGGGRQLYEELQRTMKFEVHGILYGSMPTQPLGWFRKEPKSDADFRRLRYRTSGLAVDMYKEMGAEVLSLPAADIRQALQSGILDAAEFVGGTPDRQLGLPEVLKLCMLQSYHQPAECFELLLNRRKFEALPPELKAIIDNAARAASAEMAWKIAHTYSRDHQAMREAQQVRFARTPQSILEAQLRAWDRVIRNKSQDNPLFAKIIDSQRAWAARVVGWENEVVVRSDLAYRHYFGRTA
ncbi:TRAP transporter substrate-binding protein [Azospira restricta]|uniref:TRAP transporter substrate-binding protein n=1 Tax=Azospira restricta TaxID=404405 RepID=A0A974SMJ3_9RHOO|nr:TRAP transporter substrate-binding protein [Azospira restricta]QRJ62725.1 TRAP transporter substrate-binding protein [Azospira restricta]